MRCTNCNKESEISIAANRFCKSCLIDLVEKRIKKHLKGNDYANYLQKNDKVLILGRFAEKIIREAVKGLPLDISVIDSQEFDEAPAVFIQKMIKNRLIKSDNVEIQLDKFDKIILPWTAEHECCLFLEQMTDKSADFGLLGNAITSQDKKYIKLFRQITEDELEIFAAAKGFKFARRKKDLYTNILDTMDSKYPESRFSLLKSIDNLAVALSQ